MAAAATTLCKSTSFLSLSSRTLLLSKQRQEHHRSLNWKILSGCSPQTLPCVCSIKKPRVRKKVKSNAELCNEIREFVSSVGLPEGHVPSFRELSDHGRTDLANIVRRRGYKLLRDLLTNSKEAEVDGSNLEKILVERPDAVNNNVDKKTGLKVDHSYLPKESTTNLSLEEKAVKFIESGELEGFDDDVHGMINENSIEERKGSNEHAKVFEESSEHKVNGGSAAVTLNGSALTSTQVMASAPVGQPVRTHKLSEERQSSSDLEKDLEIENGERENQVEINQLKFMLHQKELELSQLKGLIEKEKLALSDLQAKAETEIDEAQKLISEKDAELLDAEESLSGLTEVEIRYSGEGEIVELAGSFNGWHHQIKMDPQSYSSTIDNDGSRKSRLWSTMLWLYPGEYEIKFIVDGHWRIDPQRESVAKGGIINNILRVGR